EIRERGVNIERSRGGAFGQGFYTATQRGVFPGDDEVEVAIRLRRPLQGHLDEIESRIDELTERFSGTGRRLTARGAAVIRAELRTQGHDGIIVYDGGGDGVDYVVALAADFVRVVRP